MIREHEWRPGRVLPAHIPPESFRGQDQNEPEGSDEDLGPIRRGRPRNRTRKLFGEETRSSFTASTRQVRSHKTQDGQWTCPVCHQTFNKANQFAFHYEAEHAVADPSLVTFRLWSSIPETTPIPTTCMSCQATFGTITVDR